jgi:hypothetical protein
MAWMGAYHATLSATLAAKRYISTGARSGISHAALRARLVCWVSPALPLPDRAHAFVQYIFEPPGGHLTAAVLTQLVLAFGVPGEVLKEQLTPLLPASALVSEAEG